jgi:hypothetical protein
MRTVLRVLLLGVAFAIATRVLGWWGIPVTAAAWGILSPDGSGVAAVGASLAWAGLLARDAAFGPLPTLASDLGTLFHAPGLAVVALTLIYPALLAWSAAIIGGVIGGVIGGAGRSTLTSPRPTQ